MLRRLRAMGPAALVTAAFIGPGTVTTCTLAGAGFGYALLWGMLFSIIATMILQGMAARLGIVAQRDLGEAIRESVRMGFSRWLAVILVLSAIVIGNAAFETGNLLGGALGISTLLGNPGWISGEAVIHTGSVLTGFLAALLLWNGNYHRIEKVLIALVILMSLAFIGTAVIVGPDLIALLKGLFIPAIPKGSLLKLVGLIGTTVVPYNLFLHASAARERWKSEDDLKTSRLDILVSIGLGGVISLAIMVTAAATFFGSGRTITGAADLALQLEPLLGKGARIAMGIGLFAAGFTSAITAPMAAAYATRGILGWKIDTRHWKFRSIWMLIILIGLIFSQIGSSPVESILFAQVANGILLPVIAGYLFWVMNRKDLLGARTNRLRDNIAGGIVFAITLILSIRTLLTVFGIIG